jgi:hypothetical protein
MDTTKVGRVAADLMESMAQRYGEEEVEVGEVLVVVELSHPPGAETDFEESTQVVYRCSDSRGWVQRGLLEEAASSEAS